MVSVTQQKPCGPFFVSPQTISHSAVELCVISAAKLGFVCYNLGSVWLEETLKESVLTEVVLLEPCLLCFGPFLLDAGAGNTWCSMCSS